jgi:hypothetical protein
VLAPPSAEQGHATNDDDDRLSGSSVSALSGLYDEEVAGTDPEVRDIRACAKELVARFQQQFVRERNQLARRGGVDRFTMPDGPSEMHGHVNLLSRR